MSAQPVIFIHGLWVHSAAWRPWLDFYRSAGYDPHAPGWPGDGATVADTRTHPERVGGVGLAEVNEHYTKFIADLPYRPVVIGHSFGGLIAQQLLASGHATHAIAIDPGPIKGVTKVPLPQIRSALPVLKSKKNRDRAVTLSARQFHYGFTNAVAKKEADSLYTKWSIPGPGRPVFEVTSAKKDPQSPAAVDTTLGDRGPLLIIGGGRDHTVPEAVTRQAFSLYTNRRAVTTYKVFEDRGHSLVFDSRWREVADYTLDWLRAH